MVEKQTEKVKIYIVIGLALVLLVTGYFRFGYRKAAPPAKVSQTSTPGLQTGLPRLESKPGQKVERQEKSIDEPLRPSIRNIFAPGNMVSAAKLQQNSQEIAAGGAQSKVKGPASEEPSLSETESAKIPPSAPGQSLKLMGTILDGKRSMAIINGRFYREGDRIGEYLIEKIGKREVALRSDGQHLILEILSVATE